VSGTPQNRRLDLTAFKLAREKWGEWANDVGRTVVEKEMSTPLETYITETKSLKINNVVFTTTTAIEERRAKGQKGPGGANWVILKASTARDLTSVEEGGDIMPVYGRIRNIVRHPCFLDRDGFAMLHVDFFTAPVRRALHNTLATYVPYAFTNAYDKTLFLPLVDTQPSHLKELGARFVPVSSICPLHIIVQPHPTFVNAQVVLPAGSSVVKDIMFLMAAGYNGPEIR
jgi:hypothetical protein